ncbi:tRNA (adenosine(37)-N6)-dimethylallyltransferase MiaA [Sphingomonas lenta]|uniref:tRNA dimethylallyltransferase n=1 Tax=Sphingomonas lenta TaxID=1141887 RepID=A0A2A2SCF8_9SPHN|nr:tRNA (adenosine(37)-N6)-dimethylallyltransferase MiaA [Sphingomonas lenta]PAX06691.1 tRNA (adenosine(37)-N6)-dimethylallyltransferase MiaA [Sphingomonas lenta]
MDHLPRLALIAGPTASGKSAAGAALAEALGGVVINADASQVYRDLRVLTARPDAAEEARAPHRLFGYIDGAEACSAARWAAEAGDAVADAVAAGELPILVGGTGLYLRTLLDGIAPVPDIDPTIRAEARALPVAEAHRLLAELDAPAAARLHPSDITRVARALEVVRSTGRPLAHWQAERVGGIRDRYHVVGAALLPDRDALVTRTDARLATMFDEGAVDEVAALLTRDLSPDLPVMRAIGVTPIADMLAGRATRDEALARARLETRQYAKRQYTWFRNQSPPDWTREADADALLRLMRQRLSATERFDSAPVATTRFDAGCGG